jgi:hypothetical protein
VNASGDAAVIQAAAPHHIAPVFGVADGGRFVPLPHPPPYGSAGRGLLAAFWGNGASTAVPVPCQTQP